MGELQAKECAGLQMLALILLVQNSYLLPLVTTINSPIKYMHLALHCFRQLYIYIYISPACATRDWACVTSLSHVIQTTTT